MSIITGKVSAETQKFIEVSDGKGLVVPGRALDIKKQIRPIRS